MDGWWLVGLMVDKHVNIIQRGSQGLPLIYKYISLFYLVCHRIWGRGWCWHVYHLL